MRIFYFNVPVKNRSFLFKVNKNDISGTRTVEFKENLELFSESFSLINFCEVQHIDISESLLSWIDWNGRTVLFNGFRAQPRQWTVIDRSYDYASEEPFLVVASNYVLMYDEYKLLSM